MANHSDLSNAVSNFARAIEADRKALQRCKVALELADGNVKSTVRRAVDALSAAVDAAEERLPELHAELDAIEKLEIEHREASKALDAASKAVALGAPTAKEVAKLRAERDGAEGVAKFIGGKYALAVQRLGQRSAHPSTQPGGVAKRAALGVQRAEDFLRAYREHGGELSAGYQFAKRAASIVNGLDANDAAHFAAALTVAVASYVDVPKRPASKLREQAKRAIEFVIASAKPKTSAATITA